MRKPISIEEARLIAIDSMRKAEQEREAERLHNYNHPCPLCGGEQNAGRVSSDLQGTWRRAGGEVSLYLITIGQELDEGTVICPMLCPAADVSEAETIAQEIADHLGVDVLEEPKLILCNARGRSGGDGEGV